MKKSNINLGKGYNASFGLILILFTIISITISSCSKEDDIPPPSAYVPPEPDTTGGCVFLIITPELIDDVTIDFECEGPEYTVFGELEGTISINAIENPVSGGINTSDLVVEVIQTAGLEPWAGFFFDLSEKVDFSTYQAVKVSVYSPAAGQMINLKLEDSTDGSIAKEVSATTTVGNEWEELSFDFSMGDSDKYDRFVLFFDFQGPKDMETIHYFDDIKLGEGGSTGGEVTAVPTTTAPTPSVTADKVISLFCNEYMDVPIDTWQTEWSAGTLLDTMILGDDVKKYSALSFVGIEAVMNPIDVTSMTHFRTDIWTADATEFKIKLVDFGPDGMFDGGDDTEHEITFTELPLEEWISLDVPLSDFTGLTTQSNIAQLIYSAAPAGQNTVFVDNVFFYDSEGVFSAPTTTALDPTFNQMNVISMFSDVYMNVPVDTWRTEWSVADFEEIELMGNKIYKYSNLNFVGAETVMNQIDVSNMTHFHVDVWTPDAALFRIKLVDFGPDGAFGGDDTEHELIFESPAQGEWISLDIPLTDFVDLTTTENIAQLIFSGDPAGDLTLYIDNVYFHNNMGPVTEPTTPAPTPELDAADVISMFSDAYSNVPVDTWRTDWSVADFEELDIMGNATYKYSNLNFVGIETVMNQIDISEMTHFHVDIWTADADVFRVKLVDFGPDGGFQGGDDTEHELVFEDQTKGQWISLELPIADFTGLTTYENISQLIFSGLPSGEINVYVDNVYFHK
ncbi:MAG: hypothetical protein P1U56_16790 [Saprospiraceae bacterium]|nr:hypothetical protein [Saprospiraceae bacterium]